MIKLDAEPRLQGATAALVDWARSVVRAWNGGADAIDAQALQLQAMAAQIAALQGQAATAGVTGEFKWFALGAAPTGWLAGNGQTIGNVGSGATLASLTAQALFTAWWSAFTDAQLPILTSAGAGSTRGASAAADWAALKRLTVFDVRDRFIRAGGGTYAVGTKYAATEVWWNGGNAGTIIVPWTGHGVANADNTGSINSSYNVIAPSGAATTPLQTAGVRPINIALLGCFKL